MSNTNAHRLCQTLGIDLDPDWCGDMPADAFLGRVLLALALEPADAGMPSYQHDTGHNGPTMIEGARRPGYTQDRLQQLHTLATYAEAHGTDVYWG